MKEVQVSNVAKAVFVGPVVEGKDVKGNVTVSGKVVKWVENGDLRVVFRALGGMLEAQTTESLRGPIFPFPNLKIREKKGNEIKASGRIIATVTASGDDVVLVKRS